MLTSEARERIRRAHYLDRESVRHISVEQGHILEFIGEPYRFRQRLREEEQPSFEGKTETD